MLTSTRSVQRLEYQYLAAGEQGGDDLKRGVFGRGADDGQQAFFHIGQEGILLTFVEAVDFIDKENGFLPLVTPLISASLTISRISFIPERMAEKKMKWDLVALAMTLARVVLPEPGGPQKIREESWSLSIIFRSSLPSPRRCSWPKYSSSGLRPHPFGQWRQSSLCRSSAVLEKIFLVLHQKDTAGVTVLPLGAGLLLLPTMCGATFQISLAYSLIVLSLENLPTPAVLMIEQRNHSSAVKVESADILLG